MKLYYSKTSPYSRKVRLVLHEKGLLNDVEHILINPFDDHSLKDINPLAKIPVLITNEGKSIYDSPLICQYLDAIEQPDSLIPKEKCWDILQWQVLADGIMDASFQSVLELRRPKQEQSKKWLKHWANDINRSLLVMQNELESMGSATNLAHLSFATAMSYLELRLPSFIQNKSDLNVLIEWYNRFKRQDCMLATKFE